MIMANSNDLNTLLDDFLQYLIIEKSLSPLTIRQYKHYLTKFVRWMDANFVPLSPTSINLELTRQFRIYLAYLKNANGKSLNKNTQTYYVVALRSFLRYLTVKRDITTLNPEKIDLPKSSPRMISFLRPEQVTMLLNSPQISDIKGLRDKAILETFFSTGLRVSELVNLNRDQINTKTKEFGVKGKGGKVR
ncbi:MAG: site-specific integrase, partial [Dehalococcoidia bacterium]